MAPPSSRPKLGIIKRIARMIGLNINTDQVTGQSIADRPPSLGEQTGKQAGDAGTTGAVSLVGGNGGVGFSNGFVGFGGNIQTARALPGTYKLYRQMRNNPTVAIARMVASLMLKAAEWSYVPKGEDVPEDRVELVRRTFEQLHRRFMDDVVRCLDYGWSPFEKVWVPDQGDIILAKLKPLLVDNTTILVTETGAFAGLRNRGVDLTANKSFLFTYDGEAGNLYGRSLNENIKKVWEAWERDFQKWADYLATSARPIPMVEYPLGQSRDASGTTVDNHLIALAILQQLESGIGVTMPKQWVPWAEELLENGAKVEDLAAWTISWLEPKSSRGKEFADALRHWERLLLRGWLVPERAVTEGEHGTKAETETQTDIVILNSQDLMDDIMECLNLFAVDQLLVLNDGPEAKGTVRIEATPLVDTDIAFLRTVVADALKGPAGMDLLVTLVDAKALIEKSGVPIRDDAESADIVDEMVRSENERLAAEAEAEKAKAEATPEPPSNAPPENAPPAPGA